MSRIDDILARQAHDLAALQEDQARRMRRVVEDAARQVDARIRALRDSGGDRVQPFTAQHLLVIRAQLDAAVRQLTQRLDEEARRVLDLAAHRAARDVLATIRANEPAFTDAGNRIEWAVVERLSRDQGLLLHRYSIDRYGADLADRIQRQLAAGVATGLTIPQVAAQVAGTDGVFARMEGRAMLIARMETSSAYNAMHQASMEEAAAITDAKDDPDPLLKQADEYFDRRNHPASRAVHGVIAALGQPFRFAAADVEAAAVELGKSAGGILATREGAWYAGTYPLHFNERGRQIPYRASWDGGAALARMRGPQLTGIPKATIEGRWREMAA